MSQFEKIDQNNRTLSAQVAHQMASKIIAGELRAEERLPSELSLSKQFNVSRTVLRAALELLTSRGMLQTKAKSGTRIAPKSAWKIMDPQVLDWLSHVDSNSAVFKEFNEMRKSIETGAAYLAAQRATNEDKDHLRHLLQKLTNAANHVNTPNWDSDDWNSLRCRIHKHVLKATQNSFFMHFATSVDIVFQRFASFYAHDPSFYLEDYVELVDAICGKMPEAARTACSKTLHLSMDPCDTSLSTETALAL